MSTQNMTPPHKEHPPIFISCLGLFFLGVAVIGLMAQIQTVEAAISGGGQVNVFHPNWSIIMQIPDMLQGKLTASDSIAALCGWITELLYIGALVIGFETLTHAVSRTGMFMVKVFGLLVFCIVAFNTWTDYNYGTVGSGPWGHLYFAMIMFIAVGFCGVIGMYLLEHGWKRA